MRAKKRGGFTPVPIGKIRIGCSQLVRGFSLVEVLISLLVLGMGLVALFNIYPIGLQSLTYSRRLNEVSAFAQQKLEEIKSQEEIKIGKSSGTEGNLNWEMTISPLKLSEAIEVTFVELDVNFDFSGKAQSQKFVTYIF